MLGFGSSAEVYLIGGSDQGVDAVVRHDRLEVKLDGASWNARTNYGFGRREVFHAKRSVHTSVVLVKAAAGGAEEPLRYRRQYRGVIGRRDVWKSVDRRVNWTRVTGGRYNSAGGIITVPWFRAVPSM